MNKLGAKKFKKESAELANALGREHGAMRAVLVAFEKAFEMDPGEGLFQVDFPREVMMTAKMAHEGVEEQLVKIKGLHV